MNTITLKKNWHTVVIGGGQSGLATGYYLKKMNIDFIILDAQSYTGDSWRNRWDSLKLFTPAWNNGLPGLQFPGDQKSFPSKDEVADFLADYQKKFDLPVIRNAQVISLKKAAHGFQVDLKDCQLESEHVVIATGNFMEPKLPGFACNLNENIRQLHSHDYHSPEDLPAGDVLVVGAGTSGFQIALDLVSSKRNVFLAGKPTAQIPDFVFDYFGRQFVWLNKHVLNTNTPMGRKFQSKILKGGGAPLIHISPEAVQKAGVQIIDRIKDVENGWPVTDGGRRLEPAVVIWCTGFQPAYAWVKLEESILDKGHPLTNRGVSKDCPGLYFVGSLFQHSLASTWLGGVGRDARYVVRHILKNSQSKMLGIK